MRLVVANTSPAKCVIHPHRLRYGIGCNSRRAVEGVAGGERWRSRTSCCWTVARGRQLRSASPSARISLIWPQGGAQPYSIWRIPVIALSTESPLPEDLLDAFLKNEEEIHG